MLIVKRKANIEKPKAQDHRKGNKITIDNDKDICNFCSYSSDNYNKHPNISQCPEDNRKPQEHNRYVSNLWRIYKYLFIDHMWQRKNTINIETYIGLLFSLSKLLFSGDLSQSCPQPDKSLRTLEPDHMVLQCVAKI